MNLDQHAAREAFTPLAEQTKGLAKQVDLLYKLAARSAQLAQEINNLPLPEGQIRRERIWSNAVRPEGSGQDSPETLGRGEGFDRKLAGKRLKQLEEERKQAEEQLKLAAYFHRQVAWLQDRFPEAQIMSYSAPRTVSLGLSKNLSSGYGNILEA